MNLEERLRAIDADVRAHITNINTVTIVREDYEWLIAKLHEERRLRIIALKRPAVVMTAGVPIKTAHVGDHAGCDWCNGINREALAKAEEADQ